MNLNNVLKSYFLVRIIIEIYVILLVIRGFFLIGLGNELEFLSEIYFLVFIIFFLNCLICKF